MAYILLLEYRRRNLHAICLVMRNLRWCCCYCCFVTYISASIVASSIYKYIFFSWNFMKNKWVKKTRTHTRAHILWARKKHNYTWTSKHMILIKLLFDSSERTAATEYTRTHTNKYDHIPVHTHMHTLAHRESVQWEKRAFFPLFL